MLEPVLNISRSAGDRANLTSGPRERQGLLGCFQEVIELHGRDGHYWKGRSLLPIA